MPIVRRSAAVKSFYADHEDSPGKVECAGAMISTTGEAGRRSGRVG